MPNDFHEVRFPTTIALGSSGGPSRKTEIVTLGSGREQRNTRWAHGRRRYEAGSGIKSLDDLHAILDFFEERRGRLYGFRWKDRIDFKSCAPSATVSALDQNIGLGDGVRQSFQLVKQYGGSFAPYTRPIAKPVAGSLRVAVAGGMRSEGVAFTADYSTGVVTFLTGHVPAVGQAVTAGFEFDVPVRFEADELDIDLSAFSAGHAPKIPLIEIVI